MNKTKKENLIFIDGWEHVHCPVCGTLVETYDICDVCHWQNTGAFNIDGGPNKMTLAEAKMAYKRKNDMNESQKTWEIDGEIWLHCPVCGTEVMDYDICDVCRWQNTGIINIDGGPNKMTLAEAKMAYKRKNDMNESQKTWEIDGEIWLHCPVCGTEVMDYDICDVCRWQNTGIINIDGGPNKMTLAEAKEAYAKGIPII